MPHLEFCTNCRAVQYGAQPSRTYTKEDLIALLPPEAPDAKRKHALIPDHIEGLFGGWVYNSQMRLYPVFHEPGTPHSKIDRANELKGPYERVLYCSGCAWPRSFVRCDEAEAWEASKNEDPAEAKRNEPLTPDWWESIMGTIGDIRIEGRGLHERYKELGSPYGEGQEGYDKWIAEVQERLKKKEEEGE